MLEVFGLHPDEEAVYLALLDLPPVTLAEVHTACHDLDRSHVQEALEHLLDRGLVTQLTRRPRRYGPIAPEVALEAPLLQQEERLRQGRAAIETLSQRFRAAPRQTGADELVEVVVGKRRVPDRWSGAMRTARREVRTLDRPPFPDAALEPNPVELELLDKGIAVRAVYDQSGVRSEAVVEKRRAEIAAGEQARMTGEVPVRLMLVDDRLALMPLYHDRLITEGVLVVHPCALLDALSALFELVWQRALPFTLGDASAQLSDPEPLLQNTTTQDVLALLSAGLKDQAIAHRLECSDRTVQRHIQRIIDAVGAKTRFQAALMLGRQGEGTGSAARHHDSEHGAMRRSA